MVRLHCALGVRYIVNLPMWPDNPTLTLTLKAQVESAFAGLPGAILSFELGNEPNYWPPLSPSGGGFAPGPVNCSAGVNFMPPTAENPYGIYGACTAPTDVFVPGFPAYLTYADRLARAITGCGNETLPPQWTAFAAPYWQVNRGSPRSLSGPAWGDISMNPAWFRQYLDAGARCWLKESTLHYYTTELETIAERKAEAERAERWREENAKREEQRRKETSRITEILPELTHRSQLGRIIPL